MKRSLGFIVFVAALGGFLFGFDTAVISGAEGDIQELFDLSSWSLGFTVAVALIGTVIGAVTAGIPAERFGRKKIMIFIGLLYSLSAIGSALAMNWYFLIFARFIGGIGVGASSVVGPMYIAEIAPANKRGRLVAIYQLNVVGGIFIAFVSNYLIGKIDTGLWRYMLGAETIPAIAYFSMAFFIPFSPRWLVKKERIDHALKVLTQVGIKDPQASLDAIKDSVLHEFKGKHESLFKRKYRKPVIFAFLIAAFNQLSGINAIMYYAPRIFQNAGLPESDSLLHSAFIGFTSVVTTIIALSIIDRFGRRTLMFIGSLGLILFLGLITQSFYAQQFGGYTLLVYLVGYMAFFGFSQGTVIWVFVSEVFPNLVREKGQALGSFTHWAGAALVSWLFPVFAGTGEMVKVEVKGEMLEFEAGSGLPFLFFTFMMVLQLIFVWKFMPETKGKTLEELEKQI